MKAAIIANPASGKDIRRLVAHGSVFDNQEKVRMVRRILVGLAAAGVRDVLYMPEGYGIVPRALDDLDALETPVNVAPVDIYVHNTQEDTVNAAAAMQAAGAAVIIVMGGDGTSRAACKGARQTPILPLSTGTNNVFPVMAEATVAGLAAGVLACGGVSRDEGCTRPTYLEVLVNEEVRDLALVDAAVYDDVFLASRAVWDITRVRQLFFSRCKPESIGLSSGPKSRAALPWIWTRTLPARCGRPSAPACLPMWAWSRSAPCAPAWPCPWGLRPACWPWTASAKWKCAGKNALPCVWPRTDFMWLMWKKFWNTPGSAAFSCVARRSAMPTEPFERRKRQGAAMKLKAAFIFVTPRAENGQEAVYRTWTRTPGVDLLTIGVTSYAQAVEAAQKAVAEEGCGAIELCGGFGHAGAAAVARAVTVPVGVVRFDVHPGLGNVSGDTVFA